MRSFACALLFAGAFGASSPALAQQLTLPKPGTTFVYDLSNWHPVRGGDGEAVKSQSLIQILAIDGDAVSAAMVNPTTQVAMGLRTLRGLYAFESSFDNTTVRHELDQAKAVALWPLEVGRRTETSGRTMAKEPGAKEFTSEGFGYKQWMTVKRRETADTPAGKFDTFVVERLFDQIDASGRAMIRAKETFWYAPSLGWYVRFESDRELLEEATGERRGGDASTMVLRAVEVPR